MAETPASEIRDYHAHVYFDADHRDAARRVRERVQELFDVEMGRWHERPIGPHPMWSYQIHFRPEIFDRIVPWLMLNREGLTVFLHPQTGDDLVDHRDSPIWMGKQVDLNLGMFQKD